MIADRGALTRRRARCMLDKKIVAAAREFEIGRRLHFIDGAEYQLVGAARIVDRDDPGAVEMGESIAVIARRAGQHVVAVAGDGVGEGGAAHILDIRQRIVAGTAAEELQGGDTEIHRDAAGGGGKIDGIDAGAAVQHAIDRAAGEEIIAAAAEQHVGATVTEQDIVAKAA